jgi:NTE family protein
MENVPVLSTQEMGADFVIGVDLNAKQSFIKPNNVVEVLINTVNLTLVNVTKLQTEEADLLITPDLSEFNLYDTSQVSDLIKEGYRESKKRIKKYSNT